LTGALSAGVLLGQAEAPSATVSTAPLPFIGITPCRLVDSRNAAMPPGYGPPSLSPGVPNARNFTLAGQCGIGSEAQAVSLNVTVTNTLGNGYIVLYPQGSTLPPVSTLNYFAGQTVANAAVVPLASGGLTVVAGVSGTDLIIDVNGYYAGAGTGAANTFLGLGAGNFSMTGEENTAIGYSALASNIDGYFNTAVGILALANSSNGSSYNTAVGERALFHLSAGHSNIAIGPMAGWDLVSGNWNIYIGEPVLNVSSETGTTRIGIPGGTLRAFMLGVRGVGTGQADAVPVVIDSAGQLGTVSSSVRTKQDIENMADSSSALLRLRPVRFRYKDQAGDRTHFGLIAEEVEEVLPELVVRDASGQPETVLYHEMPAMLLNELQKQQDEIELLRARLAEVEALLRSIPRQ
jgi:hypothetical protein